MSIAIPEFCPCCHVTDPLVIRPCILPGSIHHKLAFANTFRAQPFAKNSGLPPIIGRLYAGYPTVCAYSGRWSGRNFNAVARSGLLQLWNHAARPCEAAKR